MEPLPMAPSACSLDAIVVALGSAATPTAREPSENPLHRLVIGG
jgi:hypothetical protein